MSARANADIGSADSKRSGEMTVYRERFRSMVISTTLMPQLHTATLQASAVEGTPPSTTDINK